MDLHIYFRVQYAALARFAYCLFFRSFLSATVLGLLHISDPVIPTYVLNLAEAILVLS